MPRKTFTALSTHWSDNAACREADPNLFSPSSPEHGLSTEEAEREAKAFCRSCPVREECLNYALGTEQRFDIWGGLNEDERRALLRERRRRAA